MKKQMITEEEKLKAKIRELEENLKVQEDKIKRLEKDSKFQNWINLFLWFDRD